MKTLQEEAEEFAINIQTKEDTESRLNAIEWFKAGATSDHVHDEIIKGKIEVLEGLDEELALAEETSMEDISPCLIEVDLTNLRKHLFTKINELKQQLK